MGNFPQRHINAERMRREEIAEREAQIRRLMVFVLAGLTVLALVLMVNTAWGAMIGGWE